MNEDIEKVYPEAYKLARKFHKLYEKNAKGFGYKTNKETRKFIPNSPNGRLMAFVCGTLVREELEKRGIEF